MQAQEFHHDLTPTSFSTSFPTLFGAFAAVAARYPEALAVSDGKQQLAYCQLEELALRMAGNLAQLGVVAGDNIAVCVPRSLDLPAVMLAILRLGASYIPLDPLAPAQRRAAMLADANARFVIALDQEEGAISVQQLRALDAPASLPAISSLQHGQLACIFYTSGSTGTPKGVEIEQAGILRMARQPQYVQIDVGTRIANLSNPAFDALNFDVWAALLNGACIVVISADEVASPDLLAQALAQRRIDTLFLTTTLFSLLMDEHAHCLAHARDVLIGGEALPPAALQRFFDANPYSTCRLHNAYGPTECATFAVVHEVLREAMPHYLANNHVPIGRVISETQAFVVVAGQSLAAQGEVGELCLAGSGLARAYRHDAARTALAFVEYPWLQAGLRLYRTGDLVRANAQGELEYMGRIDRQVKIRGHRVELAEIESHLASHPAISQAAVLAQQVHGNEQELHAYLCAAHGPASKLGFDRASLRAHLAKFVPPYMYPSRYFVLPSMPRTANGKLDVAAMQNLAHQELLVPAVEIAEGTALALLLTECANVLHSTAHPELSFVEVGGHSLHAMRVTSRLERKHGLRLSAGDLLAAVSLRSAAESMQGIDFAGDGRSANESSNNQHAEPLLASAEQQRLFFLEQLAAAAGDTKNQLNTAYNAPFAFRIIGALQVPALEAALQTIAARHDALRRWVRLQDGQVFSGVDDECSINFIALNAEQIAAAGGLEAALDSYAQLAFDLHQAGAWRAVLCQSAPQQAVLLLCFHHILIDGWSITQLLEELSQLYLGFVSGQPANLAPPAASYGDFIRQAQRADVRQLIATQSQYWRQQIALGQQRGTFAALFPDDNAQHTAGTALAAEIDAAQWQAVVQCAREQGVTLFALLAAAFALLLARHFGRHELCIGTPVAGRGVGPFEDTVGLFVNTLPLCLQLNTTLNAGAYLHDCQQQVASALRHQDVPFNEIVGMLTQRSSGNPLFDVMLVLENTDPSRLQLPPLGVQALPILPKHAKFPLTLFVSEQNGAAHLLLEYKTALLSSVRAQALLTGMQQVLAQLLGQLQGGAQENSHSVAQMSMLSANERAQLLALSQGAVTAQPVASDILLASLAQHVENQGDALAVVAGAHSLTWRELDAASWRIAQQLQQAGVAAGEVVGMCLYRGWQVLPALLAIQRIGAAWLALDPELPLERLRYMQQDASVRIVLCDSAAMPVAMKCATHILNLDESVTNEFASSVLPKVSAQVSAQAIAYVLYTSGSTGQPKGVPITREGLANYLHFASQAYCPAIAASVVSSSLNFDATLTSLLAPLVAGKTVRILPQDGFEVDQLQQQLRNAQQPLLFKVTPTHLQAMLAYLQNWPGTEIAHVLVIGGEALHSSLALALRKLLPQARLINEYGPTESVVGCAVYELPLHAHAILQEESQPIGKPITNMALYILDSQGGLCPPGTTGEIGIAGIGVSPGYLQRAELTSQKFIYLHLASDTHSQRVYRSGDLGMWHSDGQLRYLGRADEQMKLNGFRIEPGEIESQLRAVRGVAAAAVALKQDAHGTSRLFAYIVQHPSNGTLPPVLIDALQEQLARHLPKHMLPHAYIALAELPTTLNGKLDRAALPEWQASATKHGVPKPASDAGQAPNDEFARVAERIAQAFSAALGYEIDPEMNFFEAGVTSLLLMKVHADLQSSLSLNLADFFATPSVNSLAQALAGSAAPQILHADPQPSMPAPSNGQDQIAIVGMALRMPGADNLGQFWQAVLAGQECITPLDASDVGTESASGKRVPALSSLRGLYDFDPAFFGLSDADARLMDPQQRHLLMGAVHALENAGLPALSTTPRRIGVVVASSENGHQQTILRAAGAAGEEAGPERFQMALLNEKDFVSSRLAYHLNLCGPALTVQSACSSSLSALHMACQMLRSGEVEACLVGGVAADPQLLQGYPYRAGRILSPDGHCRSFSDDAAGTVPANGMGIVLLKRLPQAMLDGDRIYSVVLGSALGNDGQDKVSFTGPAVKGQEEVIVNALAKAGLLASQIGYLEAHGTGTPIGDPVEVEALQRAFRRAGGQDARSTCALASVKSQMGHMGAAAGVAGLIRASLAIYHSYLPPTIGIRAANPHLQLADSAFVLNTTARAWQAAQRYAGVSSFGMGGTNAHVVLGNVEYPVAARASDASRPAWDAPVHPFALRTLKPEMASVSAPTSQRRPLDEWFYQEQWAQIVHLPRLGVQEQDICQFQWLLAGQRNQLAQELANSLQALGAQVTWLADGVEQGAEARSATNFAGHSQLLLFTHGPQHSASDFALAHQLLQQLQAHRDMSITSQLHLTLLCQHSASLAGEAVRAPESALLSGFALVASAEMANLQVRMIDIEAPATEACSSTVVKHSAQNILHSVLMLAQAQRSAGSQHFALRGRRLWQKNWAQSAAATFAAERSFDPGVYVVFGGSGGMGQVLQAALAEQAGSVIISVARSTGHAELGPAQALGLSHIHHVRCDISNGTQMAALAAQLRSTYPRITGIFHAAGVGGSGAIANTSSAQMWQAMACKVQALQHIKQYFLPLQAQFLVLNSSMSAIVGVYGQTDYASANNYLDAWAQQQSEQDEFATRIVSINWPTWQETGMARGGRSNASVLRDFAITPSEALQVLLGVLQNEDMPQIQQTQVVVCPVALSALRTALAPRRFSDAVRGDLASSVLAAFQRVLGNLEIDVTRSFYEQGGDSLAALDLLDLLNASCPLGLQLSLQADDVLQGEVSVQSILAKLQKMQGNAAAASHAPASLAQLSASSSMLLTLRDEPDSARSVVCLHPVGGDVNAYRQLAQALPARVFALRDPLLSDDAAPVWSVAQRASHFLAALGEEAPQCLVGWSFGAIIAWRMACQMQAAGLRLPQLVLIDPPQLLLDENSPQQAQEVFLQELRLQYPHLAALPAGDDGLLQLANAANAASSTQHERLQTQTYMARVMLACQRNSLATSEFLQKELPALLSADKLSPPPMQFSGQVNLIYATAHGAQHCANLLTQWQALCQQPLQVQARQADHYSIMQAEHAQVIAALIKAN